MHFQFLRPHGTHAVPVEAVVAADVHFSRIEAQAARAARVALAERARPVVVARAHAVERRDVAVARSRKEDVIAIYGCKTIAFHTRTIVIFHPLGGSVVDQLLKVSICRHTPTATPIGAGCIV